MGVRGLMTYIENHCPRGYTYIRIADLVEKCREFPGERLEIVVDANACYSMWTKEMDWTIGLPIGELINRLKRFVSAFQEIGVDLVFFCDGLTPRKKRDTWRKRRVTSMRKMVRVYQELHAGTSFQNLTPGLTYIPPSMTNFISFVLKHVLNCKVYATVHECDEEIIDYVVEKNNSIIFTDDTDFIVSFVNSYVLSTKHFNCQKMTTRMYNRLDLNEHLNLRADQLPLLAILAGNDVVDPRSLKPFHTRVTNWASYKRKIPYNILMESLANYIINDLPGHVSTNHHIRIICYDMFYSHLKTPFLKMAHKSYFPNRRSEFPVANDAWSRVLDVAKNLMQNVQLPVPVWGVLSAYIYESNPVLEDYRMTNNYKRKSCATITRPLRRRWYGILLFERRHENRPVVEWCAENFQSYRQPVRVYPEYPSVHHPGLRALWDQNRARTHYHNKWALFLKAVSPNINNFGAWKSLPGHLVMSTAVCHYLFVEGVVNTDEIRAILVTLVMYGYYDSDALNEVWSGSPDLRAIQISVTFSRIYSIVFSMFSSCGYPVPLSSDIAHIKFEPKLFQAIIRKVRARVRLGELCHENMDAMGNFHQMKKLIYQS